MFTKNKDLLKKPESVFFVLSIIFGLLFVVLVLPFRVPDEHIHFYRAYHVSEGNVVAVRQGSEVGSRLPNSLRELVNKYNNNYDPYKNKLRKKIYLGHDTKKFLKLKLEPDNSSFYNFTGTAERSPIAYIPSALGIFIGRIIGLPVLLIFFLGRIFNLAAFILLVYLAIKIIPKYKYILLSISLLPVTIFLASSLSIDGIIIGCTFLFIACCIRFYYGKRHLGKVDLAMILLPLLVIGTSKFVYLTLILLLIPIFLGLRTNHSKLMLGVGVAVVLVISLGWLVVARKITLPNNLKWPIDERHQLKEMVERPLYFISATNNTILTKEKDFMQGFIGRLDWARIDVPLFVVAINYILIGFSTIYQDNDTFQLKRKKYLLLATILFTLYFIFALLFMTWNSPDPTYILIEGVQPRYFLPILPLLLMLFDNKLIYIKKNNQAFSLLFLTVVTVSLWITLTTLTRIYYV